MVRIIYKLEIASQIIDQMTDMYIYGEKSWSKLSEWERSAGHISDIRIHPARARDRNEGDARLLIRIFLRVFHCPKEVDP